MEFVEVKNNCFGAAFESILKQHVEFETRRSKRLHNEQKGNLE